MREPELHGRPRLRLRRPAPPPLTLRIPPPAQTPWLRGKLDDDPLGLSICVSTSFPAPPARPPPAPPDSHHTKQTATTRREEPRRAALMFKKTLQNAFELKIYFCPSFRQHRIPSIRSASPPSPGCARPGPPVPVRPGRAPGRPRSQPAGPGPFQGPGGRLRPPLGTRSGAGWAY
uniref:Uncharacterized protein n=1 Tax=Pipistrellus kuhlii TaxID=59472 RepID=A0A7J7S4K9_PIPKU|nr:hypothetical protein mPipKuh1_010185 [Pipistrellus kuhlii]